MRPTDLILKLLAAWDGLLGARLRKRHLLVLAYHSICDEPSSSLSLATAEFARQMEIAARRLRPVGLTTVLKLWHSRAPLAEDMLLVTFDDGCRDVLHNAVPILERLDIPATFFVPGAIVAGQDCASLDRRLETLAAGEIAQLAAHPLFEIGVHGFEHKNTDEIDADDFVRDVARGRKALEEITGRKIRALAYPGGKFSGAVIAKLPSAGIELAFKLGRRTNTIDVPPLELGRFLIDKNDPRGKIDALLGGGAMYLRHLR